MKHSQVDRCHKRRERDKCFMYLNFCSWGFSLPDIIQEIAKEDEERENRRIRRTIAKQERLKSCPPRLGKHKYVVLY